MKQHFRSAVIGCLLAGSLLLSTTAVATPAVEALLQQYRSEGADNFDAARAEPMWSQQQMQPKLGKPVSCASCHGSDLTQAGSHIRTGKRIEPLAPSANPERLSDTAKIEKWFARNCSWTYGRACTAQEKGDFLRYIERF